MDMNSKVDEVYLALTIVINQDSSELRRGERKKDIEKREEK